MTWYDYGSIDIIDDIGQVTCSFNPNNGDWAHTIATLTLFNGQLFMSYGDYSCNQPPENNPGHLLAWDIATGSMVDHGQFNSNSYHYNQIVNGQLAFPFTDPAIGSYPCAGFLNSDGTYEIVGNSLLAWHVYGSAYFGGKRYLSGAWFNPSTTANAYGIWRDDGAPTGWMRWSGGSPTFEPNSYLGTQQSTQIALRVFGLFVLGSTLYAAVGASLLKTTTGALGSWTSAGGVAGEMKRPMVIGSEAFYGTGTPGFFAGQLLKHNGASQTTIVGTSTVWDHTVGTDGNLYYLDTSMNIKNVSGTTVETAPSNSRSIAYVDGVWYAGTKDSHLWATTPKPTFNRVVAGSDLVKDSSGNQVIHT